MEIVSKNGEKGEGNDRLVKKIVYEMQKVDGKNKQKQLQDENREIKRKMYEMQNNMLKIMGKNL